MPPKRNLRRGLYKEKAKPEKNQTQHDLDAAVEELKLAIANVVHITGERNAAIWTLRSLCDCMDPHYYAGSIEYEDGDGIEQLTIDSVPEHTDVVRQAMLVVASEYDFESAPSQSSGLLSSPHARLVFERMIGPNSNMARRITAMNVIAGNEQLLWAFRELCLSSESLENTTESMGQNLDQLTAIVQALFNAAMEQSSGARLAGVMQQENPILSDVSLVSAPANVNPFVVSPPVASAELLENVRRYLSERNEQQVLDSLAPASVFGMPVVENSNVPPGTLIGIDYGTLESALTFMRSGPPTFEDTIHGPIYNPVYGTRDIASDPDLWVQAYQRTYPDIEGNIRDHYTLIRRTPSTILQELSRRQSEFRGSSTSRAWVGGRLNDMYVNSLSVRTQTDGHTFELYHTIDCSVNTRDGDEITYRGIPITAITHIDRRGIRMVNFDLSGYETRRIGF